MNKLSETALHEWSKKYPDFTVVRALKSGKEADLWLVSANSQLYALKVYRPTSLRTRQQYQEGQWIAEASLRKAVRQKTRVGKSLQQRLWTKREYYLLRKLKEQQAIVPAVYDYSEDAILMQYIGGEDQPAPRLIDVALSESIKSAVQAKIETSIQLFLENGIVHADLSPYNILWWNGEPWIIDFPQAIDIRHNPHWRELFERDVKNIRHYFSSLSNE